MRGKKGKEMNKTFTFNNKLYHAKEFDFNFLCDLEDQGLSLEEIEKKPFSLLRTYLAFCGNLTKEQAGKEIEAHIEKGGKLNDITDVLSSQMEDSGFFRSLNTQSEAEEEEISTENPKKKRKSATIQD